MVGGLMKWYGEPLDLKVKVPKSLPEYAKDADIDKLRAAAENKQTHKGTIARDRLLIDLALNTGMRRDPGLVTVYSA